MSKRSTGKRCELKSAVLNDNALKLAKIELEIDWFLTNIKISRVDWLGSLLTFFVIGFCSPFPY